MLETLLPALGNFFAYFVSALILLMAFKYIYVWITPHDEWQLIKEQQNLAAALGLGGAMLGFAVAVGGVISNSLSLLDFLIWAVIALLAQLLAFAVVRFIFMPKLIQRIEAGEVSAGVMLGVTSVAVGVLNAACMTY